MPDAMSSSSLSSSSVAVNPSCSLFAGTARICSSSEEAMHDVFSPVYQPTLICDNDLIVGSEFDLRSGSCSSDLMLCTEIGARQHRNRQPLGTEDDALQETNENETMRERVADGRDPWVADGEKQSTTKKRSSEEFQLCLSLQSDDLGGDETSVQSMRGDEGSAGLGGGGTDVAAAGTYKRIPDSVWTEFTEAFRAIESAVIEGLRCSISVHHSEFTFDRPHPTPAGGDSSAKVTRHQIIVAPKPEQFALSGRRHGAPIDLSTFIHEPNEVRIKTEPPEAATTVLPLPDENSYFSFESSYPLQTYKVEDEATIDERPSCVFWPPCQSHHQFRHLKRTVTASTNVPVGSSSSASRLFTRDSTTVTTRFQAGRQYFHVSPSLPTEYFSSTYANKSPCRYSKVEAFRAEVRIN